MGMYTEIFVKVNFKEDVDKDVIDTIKYMLGDGPAPEYLPSHDLFTTSRWRFMLQCSSFYHQPMNTSNLYFSDVSKQYYLCCKSDFKNYDGEAEKFFDWIKNHVESYHSFLGYTLYEEDTMPTLYFTDKTVVIDNDYSF